MNRRNIHGADLQHSTGAVGHWFVFNTRRHASAVYAVMGLSGSWGVRPPRDIADTLTLTEDQKTAKASHVCEPIPTDSSDWFLVQTHRQKGGLKC